MQFLAAKSRCTKRFEERYSIPLATSKQTCIIICSLRPYIYNTLTLLLLLAIGFVMHKIINYIASKNVQW